MLSRIDNLPFVNQKNAFYLLLAMHIAGIVGLSIETTRGFFQTITPLNLLATAAIVLHFEKFKTKRYFIFIILTFLIGFFAEVVGVNTGLIFGEYSYGRTLGWKLFNVPLAIGFNWIIMVYCSALMARSVTRSKYYAIFLGAFMLTVIDVLIEPVAIKLDFWQWSEIKVPLQNYLGWFIVSLALHFLFFILMPKSNNSLAIRLLYILISFFIALNFI